MPIEIRELHIKTVVEESGQQAQAPERRTGAQRAGKEEERESIIADAVAQVMQILESKKER